MKSANVRLEAIFNELLASTDINVGDAEKIVHQSLIGTIGAARRFEKCPFSKPTDMSDAEYEEVKEIYLELRIAYFNHTHDIFSWVRMVEALRFTCMDTRAILLEKIQQLVAETSDTVLDWKTPIYALFGKAPKWKARVMKLINTAQAK